MNVASPRWLSILDRLYTAVLRLYPRTIRECWGNAMRQAFRDRCREVARGERSVLSLLRESVPDVAVGAGREHLAVAGDAPMSRQCLALACLLVFLVTLSLQQRLADTALASIETVQRYWVQYQARLDHKAVRQFWRGVASGLDDAGASPRQRTLITLSWLQAGEPEHAIVPWRKAISGGDPAAMWLAAIDCTNEVCGIDTATAIARWQQLEPDNAAPALFAFERAVTAGKTGAAEAALKRAALARIYRVHDAELLKALLPVVESSPMPPRLRTAFAVDPMRNADALAIDAWSGWALPRFDALLARCRPIGDAARDAHCIAVARLLADSQLMFGQAIGRLRRTLREHDIPTTAPEGYRIPPRLLDPSR